MREASKCLDCSHFWRSNRSQPDRNVCECGECEGLLVFGNVTKTGDKAVDNYVHPSIGKPLCRFCSSSRAGERALRSSDRPTDRATGAVYQIWPSWIPARFSRCMCPRTAGSHPDSFFKINLSRPQAHRGFCGDPFTDSANASLNCPKVVRRSETL